MRIRWLATDPAATAERLARVLGVELHRSSGRLELGLGETRLEFVGQRPGVRPDDRLELVDERNELTGASTLVGSNRLLAVGVATVDPERYAAERGWRVAAAPADRVLGASVMVVDAKGPPDPLILLLEADTEGRIAASLARLGEGPAALYVRAPDGIDEARAAVAARGARATAVASGPFGRSFAIAGGPPWGPHVVIVESDVLASTAGTIRG